ncbi:MAG: FAD-dependent thymidylate synthase [Firmicutes bacterium]|nr:FAD-dependent thymidylate synthase [Bacillota bacterium]
MQVILLGHTPEPEKAVAMAARLCYSASEIASLRDKLDGPEVERLVRSLRDMGHMSPFEHASFTFGVSGVSRALSHQLVRHRIASYSQKSQRYVSEKQFEFVTPPSIAGKPEAIDTFNEGMRLIQDWYNRLVGLGIPKEDARYVLPNACTTQVICTFNARSLFNFFTLRCCARAQWEIRSMAESMLALVREVAPVIFENAGPACVSEGRCREGEMSCGRYRTVQERRDGRRTGRSGPGMSRGEGS